MHTFHCSQWLISMDTERIELQVCKMIRIQCHSLWRVHYTLTHNAFPQMSHSTAAQSVIIRPGFTPVQLILQTPFVSNNLGTINQCPCLTKRPSSELPGCFVGQREGGDNSRSNTFYWSICSCSHPVPISVQLWSFPRLKKTAFHTHSALKLLLEGKEALKGLNPRADGTWASMEKDRLDGRGKNKRGNGGQRKQRWKEFLRRCCL